MKLKTLSLFAFAFLSCSSMNAQITERERPVEWKDLILGARFMDRFEAMPDGALSSDVWGAKNVIPRFVDNGIESKKFSFWGGNIIQTDDGLYHLFVCGWPENSPKGHMFWPKSTVFHAVSKQLHGPYTIKGNVGKGHNPEAYRLDDGRYIVYVIDGYYMADDINGPWVYGEFEFNKRDRKIIEGLSNLTFARRQDGSRIMICRGGGVWISKDGLSTYNQISDKRVYPAVKGEFEDPVIWRDSIQYHLIVNDWLGRIAFYQRSKDGLNWITEQGEAYVPGISFHKDGKVEKWFKYERLKIFQDKYGRAVQANFAVIDSTKWDDMPNDNHSSKNICVPLNKGMLLSVLGSKPINASTKSIEVLIKAEEEFNPQTDIDIQSLRFGSFNEVNFGRGAKVIKTKKSGNDLLVVFNGKGSGIDENEFAPKMIGKDKNGKMIFGYAALPSVDYKPALLSALCPKYDTANKLINLEVQNFGLTESKPVEVEIVCSSSDVVKAKLASLKPYDKTVLTFQIAGFQPSEKQSYQVNFYSNGKLIQTNQF